MRTWTLLLLTAFWMNAAAQLNPVPTIYFFNPYEVNPAMAGVSGGFEVNVAIKTQWTGMPGAPMMQSLTFSGATANKKVGAGLNIYNEKAGLMGRTSLKGSYAFHVPLDYYGDYTLDLGLSAGLTNERMDMKEAKGDLEDPVLQAINQRPVYIDGDFGIAYRCFGLTLQGVLPNLRRLFTGMNESQTADRFLYLASAAYLFEVSDERDLEAEPLVMFRKVQGYRSLWDAGMRLQFSQRKLNSTIIYHNTGSLTVGVGTVYAEKLGIQASYTSNGRELGKYGNGEFTIALKYCFGQKEE